MSNITPHSPIGPDDSVDHDDPFGIGKWVWVKDSEDDEWLGCVLRHGSNYVYIEGIKGAGGYSNSNTTLRCHVDNIYERLRPEEDADTIIRNKTGFHQSEVNRLLGRVKEETAKLGVAPKTGITQQTGKGDNSLAVISEQVDTKAYKTALAKTKDEILPELFEQVEKHHQMLAAWMKAPVLPMMAQISPMKDSIGAIEERIYTIDLYAGLTEHAAKVKDGDPAKTNEKLRVMQRLHFMDEEALLDLEHGGMELEDVVAFDSWLARENNFERLLPFSRCCAAFRVRRDKKQREAANIAEAWMNAIKGIEDMTTFLYVRNGEQLWRIGCNFDFGMKIFPDQDEFDPVNGGFMLKMFGSRVDKIITRNEYEVRKADLEVKLEEWHKLVEEDEKLPEDKRPWRPKPTDRGLGDFEPMDPTSVYFDDGMAMVDDQVKEFNRIAVIIQGLFDRSLALHPHEPVSVWDNASFQRSIELIYDATTLTHGEAPDFEAYAAKLRESLEEGSVTLGQHDQWTAREAERENNRTLESWREKTTYHEHYWPYGDPGPGKFAEIKAWKPRAKKATYRWEREPRNWQPYQQDPVKCSIVVEAEHLFNVSAYQPGDYLQFFKDPRTRAEYLKWAPLLLAAEEYHAGKVDLEEQSKYG